MRTSRFLTVLALAITPASATGQSIGPRAGISIEPQQFHFGAHVETAPLADRLRFRPNVEIGVGDDRTTTALNLEFAYHFPSAEPWSVYTGAGPALNITTRGGDAEAEPGVTVLAGLAHEDGLFLEAKAGAFDSPRFKLTVGYAFRLR